MPEIVDGMPQPKSHIKTLTKIGYDLNSAISDIIDNSITALASEINIKCPPSDNPYVLISDDGHGMDLQELLENMKIGCKDPDDDRELHDLGRFGSGMKTASFSQARKMTVITKKKDADIAAARWDIDLIEETNSWCLEKLDLNDVQDLPGFDKSLLAKQGTIIIWENLHFIKSNDHAELENIIDENMANLIKHISLHFHKFLKKEKFKIKVQGNEVVAIDPFMTSFKGYQSGKSEIFNIKTNQGRLTCEIKVHVLPHHENLTKEEIKQYGGMDEIYKNQGLYIYRSNRLIIAGGWMGLSRSYQLGKLARIEINVPSGLDKLWATDVKKSSLQLPNSIRQRLKKLVTIPIKKSTRAYTYRGTKEVANDFWRINENKRENTISYEIDVSNPELESLRNSLSSEKVSSLRDYLVSLSKNLPINHIYERMSTEPKSINQEDADTFIPEELAEKLKTELELIWRK
jgi:hypothetical protein